MKLVKYNFPAGHTGIFLEQVSGDKIYAAERIFTWAEMRNSNCPWRTLLYINIRNLRRYIRKSIEEED